MKFQCHYCPKVSKDLTTAIRHFEDKHRDRDEQVEIQVPEDMIEPIKAKAQNDNRQLL